MSCCELTESLKANHHCRHSLHARMHAISFATFNQGLACSSFNKFSLQIVAGLLFTSETFQTVLAAFKASTGRECALRPHLHHASFNPKPINNPCPLQDTILSHIPLPEDQIHHSLDTNPSQPPPTFQIHPPLCHPQNLTGLTNPITHPADHRPQKESATSKTGRQPLTLRLRPEPLFLPRSLLFYCLV